MGCINSTSVDLISDDLNSKSEKSENLDEGSKEDSENSQIESMFFIYLILYDKS